MSSFTYGLFTHAGYHILGYETNTFLTNMLLGGLSGLITSSAVYASKIVKGAIQRRKLLTYEDKNYTRLNKETGPVISPELAENLLLKHQNKHGREINREYFKTNQRLTWSPFYTEKTAKLLAERQPVMLIDKVEKENGKGEFSIVIDTTLQQGEQAEKLFERSEQAVSRIASINGMWNYRGYNLKERIKIPINISITYEKKIYKCGADELLVVQASELGDYHVEFRVPEQFCREIPELFEQFTGRKLVAYDLSEELYRQAKFTSA